MKREDKESTLKQILMWLPDTLYSIVCGNLECTYCAFYRGVVVGTLFWGVVSTTLM